MARSRSWRICARCWRRTGRPDRSRNEHERDAGLLMRHERQKDSSRRITVGADKAYDTKNFIAGAVP